MDGGVKVAVDEDAQVTEALTGSTEAPATEVGQRGSCDCRRADAHHITSLLSLIGIKPEPIRAHPAGYVVDGDRNVGRKSRGGGRRTGAVNQSGCRRLRPTDAATDHVRRRSVPSQLYI